MAIVAVQDLSGSATSGTTVTKALANTTTGNAIYALVTLYTGGADTVSGVTYNGSAMTLLIEQAGNASASEISIWYLHNITGATTPSVIATRTSGTVQAFDIRVLELSGMPTTFTADGTAAKATTGNSSPMATPAITTTGSNTIIFGLLSPFGTGTAGETGWHPTVTTAATSVFNYEIVTSAQTALTSTGTQTGGSQYFALIAGSAGSSGGGTVALAGTVQGKAAITGALNVTRNLSATVAGHAAITGALKVTRNFAGAVQGKAAITGALTTFKGAGTVQGKAAITGALSVTRNLSGTVQGKAAITGALTVTRNLAGTVQGKAAITGALKVTRNLAGSVTGHGSITGALNVTRNLAGTVQGHAAITGALTSFKGAGTVQGKAAITAALKVTRNLSGTVQGKAAISGQPTIGSSSTYYVTQTASGGGLNNGSSSNPWSLSTFNGKTTPTGGDTVCISGNITGTVTPSCNGSSGHPITFDLTGTISGTACTFTTGGILFSANSYLTFNGGTFSSTNTGISGTDGALVGFAASTASDHITLQGMSFAGNSSTGVTDFVHFGVANHGIGTVSNLLLQNNTMSGVSHFVDGSDSACSNITLLNNSMTSSANTTQQSDVISLYYMSNVLIQGNYLKHNTPGSTTNGRHNDCIQCSGGGGGTPTNWTICYNWIELAESGGDGDNSWMMMEGMGSNIEIFGNVFKMDVSDPGNGIAFDTNASGNTVFFYNNTCVAKSGISGPVNFVRFLQGTGTNTLYARNNILYVDPSFSGTMATWTYTAGATWDYNYFFNAHPDGNYYGSHGSQSVDPKLNNYSTGDYTLDPSSPCLGSGDSAIGSTYNQGIAPSATWPNPALNSRAASWDIGAFQSSASVSLGGTVQGKASITGALKVTRNLSGTATGHAAITGALKVTRNLAGTVQGKAAITANLSIGSAVHLAGTVQGKSSITGALTVTRNLSGSAQGHGAITGALKVTRNLSGTAQGHAAITGQLTIGAVVVRLAGSVVGRAALTGALTVGRNLSGSVLGHANSRGNLTVGTLNIAPLRNGAMLTAATNSKTITAIATNALTLISIVTVNA